MTWSDVFNKLNAAYVEPIPDINLGCLIEYSLAANGLKSIILQNNDGEH